MFAECYESDLGRFRMQFDEAGTLVEIELPRSSCAASLPAGGRRPRGAPARRAVQRWLDAWTHGDLRSFPGRWRMPGGSPFFSRVYREVARIPVGRTRSYQEVARRCGSPRASRAVGTAMARNPMPLLVPCHRVLSSRGLGGFGAGLALKRRLLELEGASGIRVH